MVAAPPPRWPLSSRWAPRSKGNRVILIGDSVMASTSRRYCNNMCEALVPAGLAGGGRRRDRPLHPVRQQGARQAVERRLGRRRHPARQQLRRRPGRCTAGNWRRWSPGCRRTRSCCSPSPSSRRHATQVNDVIQRDGRQVRQRADRRLGRRSTADEPGLPGPTVCTSPTSAARAWPPTWRSRSAKRP